MSDWNMSWKKWVAGDADPTTTALVAHPPLPHDSEPKAPAYQSSSTPPPATSSPSPTPRHSSSPTPKPHHSGHRN
jgi:hypothetical protein